MAYFFALSYENQGYFLHIWFLLQKPIGLVSLLDEESNFPKATDTTFANKLKQHLNANSCFKGERGQGFRIKHYAGEVSCYPKSNNLCAY